MSTKCPLRLGFCPLGPQFSFSYKLFCIASVLDLTVDLFSICNNLTTDKMFNPTLLKIDGQSIGMSLYLHLFPTENSFTLIYTFEFEMIL
jgi:hypothetical protein